MDIVVVEVVFPISGQEKALLSALKKLALVAKASKGCLQYDLLTPAKASTEVMVFMRFDSEENLQNHEKSEYISTFVKENKGKTYDNFTYSMWKVF